MVKQNPMINIGLERSRYLCCQSLYHPLSLVVIHCATRCHSLSLVVPLVVIRCTTCCHSLSFVVTRCTTCCHLLSFVVTRCTTRLFFFIDDRFSIVISIKFDSFNVKAIVTKKVAKKRNLIIEFLSCDCDESKS